MNPFQSIGQTQWNPDYRPLPPAPFKFQIYRTKYAGEPDKFALSRTSSQYGPRVADETLVSHGSHIAFWRTGSHHLVR